MKEISLTQGYSAIVDDEDYDSVSSIVWHTKCLPKPYAFHGNMKMERFILNPPEGLVIDHINGDGLDNRKNNLRVCSQGENTRNRSKQSNASKRYKGVYLLRGKYWGAKIYPHGKQIFLGYYSSDVDAALAYNAAALKHYGEYARLNIIG